MGSNNEKVSRENDSPKIGRGREERIPSLRRAAGNS
jgi:hypothetical protein